MSTLIIKDTNLLRKCRVAYKYRYLDDSVSARVAKAFMDYVFHVMH